MKKNILSAIITLFAAVVYTGCSGDGRIQPTSAVLQLSSSGTLTPGSLIGGIDVTVLLPPGVTVQASPDSANPAVLVPDDGIVSASGAGSGSTIISVYTAPSSTTGATVRIGLIDGSGFSGGEFATIHCIISAGYFPQPSDFSLANFTAWDVVSTATISGLTAGLTVELQ